MVKKKVQKTGISHDELKKQYDEKRPSTERFCTEIHRQIKAIVDSASLGLGFPIQYRVKTWGSIKEKLTRLSLVLNSIDDLQDLVGVRIILLYQRDVGRICEFISNVFMILEEYDTKERLSHDQFGYASRHMIVGLPPEWTSIPTLSGCKDLLAEIQVRTVSQHLWAEVSHHLQYKRKESVPDQILRSLYRASALLESVDLELERVLDNRLEYVKHVANVDQEENLNVNLLEQTLNRILPPQNKEENEDFDNLLIDLSFFDITTIAALIDLWESQKAKVLEDEAGYVKENRKKIKVGQDDEGINIERAAKDVYFVFTGLIRIAMSHKFGKEWDSYFAAKRKRA